MMSEKISKNTCIFILLLFLVVPFTSALGISPAKKNFLFEPYKTEGFKLTIINSERNNLDLSISVSDDLDDLFFFENKTISLLETEYKKSFNIFLKFPSEMRPGVHKGFLTLNTG